VDISEVRGDLLAEQAALDEVMAALTADQWALPTPSPRWTVADQIGHLTYFDDAAATAITDPDGFDRLLDELLAVVGDGDEAMDELVLGRFRRMSPPALLAEWRSMRVRLSDASAELAGDARVPWYGPSMGAKSFLTARLMEVWAHGQDIIDTIGANRAATDRIRHIAQLGFITRGWSYVNRGLEAPDVAIRVELDAPSGDTWTFGPDDASQTVVGSAEHFALVVTQRRHLDDTDLVIDGDAAAEWLAIAQAFAGGATDGPTPR